jgi:hypothetical protein
MFEELKFRSFVYRATAPDAAAKRPERHKTIVTRALLGSDAGLIGAARLPLLRGVD